MIYQAIVISMYVLSVPVWLLVWRYARGFELSGETPQLWLPFILSLFFLSLNLVLMIQFHALGDIEYEEGRFIFIGERASIAVQATASVLIVATIVYGLTVRKLPVAFIRFMVYAVIALLGFMAPIVWIPTEVPEGFFVLRHFQTIALTFGLFLCVAGVVVLLNDLLRYGEAQMRLAPPLPEEGETGPAPPDASRESTADRGSG